MGLALAETSSNSMAQRITCATMSFRQGWYEKVVELLPLLALEGEVIIMKRSSWNEILLEGGVMLELACGVAAFYDTDPRI